MPYGQSPSPARRTTDRPRRSVCRLIERRSRHHHREHNRRVTKLGELGMRRGLYSLSMLALSAALASPALAQQAEPATAPPVPAPDARTTVYDAAFFTQYAPRTALDIARRVP